MPNKKYAEEWLRLADQHYNAAKSLDNSDESKKVRELTQINTN